jgi:sulfatase modifying factor 1
VTVCADTFNMGCTPGQSSCESDESPVRPTTLTQDYYMSRTEVTQAQFSALMGYNPSNFTACGSTCPVEQVSWHEAAAFANAASVAAGLARCYSCSGSGSSVTCSAPVDPYACVGYRLPTEAEWEGAARCGEDLRYAGSNTIDSVAWYSSNSGGAPRAVAGKSANACGLYDMSGNVWDWVNDWYTSSAYSGGGSANPSGPSSGVHRVSRGGQWFLGPVYARVSTRGSYVPSLRNSGIGFRVARTAP